MKAGIEKMRGDKNDSNSWIFYCSVFLSVYLFLRSNHSWNRKYSQANGYCRASTWCI